MFSLSDRSKWFGKWIVAFALLSSIAWQGGVRIAYMTEKTATQITDPAAVFIETAFSGDATQPYKVSVDSFTKKVGVNVKGYGAVGDGTTDDTAAIQLAIDSANGRPVYLPTGTYKITSTINAPSSPLKFTLYGDGRNSSIISAATLALGTDAIDISDSTWTHLHDFAVVGGNSDSLNGHAIYGVDSAWSSGAFEPQQLIIERLSVTYFKGYQTMPGAIRGGSDLVNMPAAGIMLGQALQVSITDCFVGYNDFGMYLYDCDQPIIQTNAITTNTIAGIVDESSESPEYFKNDIVGNCPTKQTFTTMIATPRRASATCEGAGIVILGASGTSVTSNKIKNSYIGLLVECEDSVSISKNWIRADVKTGVLAYGPANVIDNNFNPAYVAPYAVTVDSSTDIITATAHGFANGEEVFFWGTSLPTGIPSGTRHYVRDATTNTFKVAATSGGSAIDITTNGTSVSVGICRRHIHYNMPSGGFLANIGTVRDNRLSFNGGGPFYALIDLESAGSVIDGVIDSNSIGESTAQSNATVCGYAILCTSSSRKLTITDNVSHVSGNVNLILPIYVSGTSTTPGPKVARNLHYNNGGTITFASIISPSGPYEYIDENNVINRSGVTERQGTGSPEGIVTAIVGSRFYRTDGGASTTLYVKESGTGNTGWVAK